MLLSNPAKRARRSGNATTTAIMPDTDDVKLAHPFGRPSPVLVAAFWSRLSRVLLNSRDLYPTARGHCTSFSEASLSAAEDYSGSPSDSFDYLADRHLASWTNGVRSNGALTSNKEC